MNQRGLVVFFLLSLVFVSSFVAAAEGDWIDNVREQGGKFMTNVFDPIAKGLLGNVGADQTDVYLVKFLLLVAYFSIVWAVLSKTAIIGDKPGTGIVISFVVALIGIRYLTPEAILAGALSASATVLALFIFGTFAVFFYVIQSGVKTPLLRKLAWIILAACYVGIYATSGLDNPATSWIYITAAVLSGVIFWFDGTIQSLWNRAKAESDVRASGTDSYEKLLVQAENMKQNYLAALTRGDKDRASKAKAKLGLIENALAEAAKLS